MKITCIGEELFCDTFALIGAEYFVCQDAHNAFKLISSRTDHDELILISETLSLTKNRDLESVLNDPKRMVISIPFINSTADSADSSGSRALLRKLMGASWD
jgi:vacuolar-type H+-ATPase subunit F/Vma7